MFPYPNATVAEFGDVWGEKAMMSEIYARGRRPLYTLYEEQSFHTAITVVTLCVSLISSVTSSACTCLIAKYYSCLFETESLTYFSLMLYMVLFCNYMLVFRSYCL